MVAAAHVLLPVIAAGQSLAGKRVVISPSHGYYWHSSLGWTTQRPLIDGLIEDIHSNEIVMDHLFEYLEGAGARVISCRARTRTLEEHVIQNDDGFPSYEETGNWVTSSSSGWQGSSYRFALTSPAGGSTATFRASIGATDHYPVYLAYRAGTNRSAAVRIEVEHAGGTSLREIDQKRDGLRWVYIGSFPFRAGDEARVTVTSTSTSPGVVISDAVKIGDGFGSIARGGQTSGQPRWRECSRYHAEYFGAPSSVWNPSSGPQDNSDDVTCRPNYAEWWGADIYLSLHTNAGGGSGTSTFIHNNSPTAGSALFQSILHPRLINDLRAFWDPSWQDDGQQSANFGEVRELVTMPGTLVELAFHDDIGGDIEALHHPRFRRVAARALYRGIASYFGATWVLEPPSSIAMRNDGQGKLSLSWLPVAGATSYRIRLSADGFGFDDGQVVLGTDLQITGLSHGEARFAKIAAINAGGVGPDSEPVGARLAPGATSRLLMVHGFDRRDRFVKKLENRRDALVRAGGAVTAVAAAGYPFDGCTNEAVTTFLVPLADYQCLGWTLGEESTVDETFSGLEQAFLSSWLAGGGRLFFSGAEVGWDLDAQGLPGDRAFYEGILGQDYVADDAGTYFTQAQVTGPLGPLPAMQFDDGSSGIYDVDFPDVLQVPVGQNGEVVLRYANGAGAGVLRQDGRVLGLGFPIDALVDPADRAALMTRILDLMCPLRLEPPGPIVLGQTLAVDLDFPDSANEIYGATASLSPFPGTPLGDGRWFPLQIDILTSFVSSPGQTIFTNLFGTLDAAGHGQIFLGFPNVAGISGFTFYMAAATVTPAAAVHEISPWRRFVLP